MIHLKRIRLQLNTVAQRKSRDDSGSAARKACTDVCLNSSAECVCILVLRRRPVVSLRSFQAPLPTLLAPRRCGHQSPLSGGLASAVNRAGLGSVRPAPSQPSHLSSRVRKLPAKAPDLQDSGSFMAILEKIEKYDIRYENKRPESKHQEASPLSP